MDELESIAAVQRQLLQLITDPDGVEAALQSGGDIDGSRLRQILRSDRKLAAADRLEVYSNAYFVRIQDCLREDFGALAAVLGEAAFHDLVKTYLMINPPVRPSLRHAGARLARHLRTEPFAAIFSRRCPYAGDLAELEWAISEAFYAADTSTIGPDALAQVAPEDWADLRFQITPTLQVVACDWPVQQVREHFDEHFSTEGEGNLPLVEEPTKIRVWRRGESVLYRAMAQFEADALTAASAGKTFGSICGDIALALGDIEAPQASATLLADWLSGGLVAGIRFPATGT
jgi:hypothetical protein